LALQRLYDFVGVQSGKQIGKLTQSIKYGKARDFLDKRTLVKKNLNNWGFYFLGQSLL